MISWSAAEEPTNCVSSPQSAAMNDEVRYLMGKLRNVLTSVKQLGVLSALFALGGALTGLLGHGTLPVTFVACALGFLAAMLYASERSRQSQQKKIVALLRTEIGNGNKQNTKSLGLIFRELRTLENKIRAVEAAMADDDSPMAMRQEEQLATYLRALSASTNELHDAIHEDAQNRVELDEV